jgi:hypothetical protein
MVNSVKAEHVKTNMFIKRRANDYAMHINYKNFGKV